MSSRTMIKGQRDHGTVPTEDPYGSPAARRAEGKALRDAVPREGHAGWTPPKDRRDPVELPLESNEGGMADLVPIRHGRMLQSPFAFYRGTAAVMAADLAHTPASGLRVQVCGDAHLSNFGGFATPERDLIFDINDLDETLPAPWEWDVKRLTASVVLAGRHIQLSQSGATRAAVAAVRSYRKRMAEYAFMKTLDVWYDKIDVTRYLKNLPDEEARARATHIIEGARAYGRGARFPEAGRARRLDGSAQGQSAAPVPCPRAERNRVQGHCRGSAGALPRVPARARPRAAGPLSSLRGRLRSSPECLR